MPENSLWCEVQFNLPPAGPVTLMSTRQDRKLPASATESFDDGAHLCAMHKCAGLPKVASRRGPCTPAAEDGAVPESKCLDPPRGAVASDPPEYGRSTIRGRSRHGINRLHRERQTHDNAF